MRSRMRENFTYGSYGEGLETGLNKAPRQSFTRHIICDQLQKQECLDLKKYFPISCDLENQKLKKSSSRPVLPYLTG